MTRFYLQYSITTKSSLFFRLVVQAPRRLTILRCLWKKKSVFRAWLSWLPSQVHHDLELSHECFQVGDVSCQLHHLDGNHCFFLPRLDPESISLHYLGRERESQYPGRDPPCKRADPPSTIIPTFPPPKKNYNSHLSKKKNYNSHLSKGSRPQLLSEDQTFSRELKLSVCN